jgi:hypothetical protein
VTACLSLSCAPPHVPTAKQATVTPCRVTDGDTIRCGDEFSLPVRNLTAIVIQASNLPA